MPVDIGGSVSPPPQSRRRSYPNRCVDAVRDVLTGNLHHKGNADHEGLTIDGVMP
jgi:hypothetical protein